MAAAVMELENEHSDNIGLSKMSPIAPYKIANIVRTMCLVMSTLRIH